MNKWVSLILVLLVGAFIGSRFPSTNLIGKAAGKVGV